MTPGELILRCFHARTNAHVLHLTTRSYAAHKALNEFYDGLLDLVDSLAESCMGTRGPISFPQIAYEPSESAEDMLADLLADVEEYRDTLGDKHSHLVNICDEIKALITSTLYKLQFLK